MLAGLERAEFKLATAKKGTAPRKAAAKRTPREDEPQFGGHVDGDLPELDGDEEEAVEQPAAVKKNVPAHPYGDREVYVYQPKDGSAPIVFPSISEVRPTQKFFWKIYQMNEMFQSFEWMNLAEVPKSIQERVLDLGEKDVYEQAEFFRGWFAPISRPQGGMTPPGES